jgi:dienelactone hydrolase
VSNDRASRVDGKKSARLLYAAVAVIGALLLAAHVPAATPTSLDPSLVRLFDYARRATLGVRTGQERIQRGVRIQQISFAVPRLRLRALLLLPQATGRHPGVVIAPEGVADRESFLAEGLLLARRGAVVLLVDGPWAAARLLGWPTCTARDRTEVIRSVLELRRALDVLTTRADVDRSRLAVMGFSYSAWTAGILAGVERRPRAFVLASGEATMTRFLGQQCGSERRYLARMRAFDPVLYVGHAAPAALLIQNGRSDEYWPRPEMVRLQKTASRPKTVRWYDASHALNEAAERDRNAWLAKRLRLSP